MGIRTAQWACLVTAAVAALLPHAALAAQATPQTGRIAAIKVAGSERYAEAQIAAASGLHVGDTVSREELQAAADRLAQLGLFSSARFRFSSSGENISVTFQVEDAPTVPVSFDNFPWFTDAELTDALKQAVTLFDGTAPQQGSILDTMTQALEKLLAARGLHPTVEHALLADPAGGGMMQQFKVVGAELKIAAVQFGDTLAAESRRVQDRLPDLVGKPYSRFALEVFANEQVRPIYLERGCLRVRIGKPEVRLSGNPDRPLPDSVLVVVPIESGPVYLWGGAEWHGNEALGPAALNESLGFETGEVANGIKIAAGWLRVEAEYGSRGYLHVQVQPEPIYDDAAKRVSYRVAIKEGVVYHMGELVITGLSPVAERKLVAAWRIPRGQVFDRIYFDDFLATGIKKAFADYVVHYEEVGHWLRTNPEARTVDVLLDFK